MAERKSLIKRRTYPVALSFAWRITHFIPYIIGGTTFLVGSLCYFTEGELAGEFQLGGWLFTIGSVGFLFADIFEWYQNNRVGCIDSSEERQDWERVYGESGSKARSLFALLGLPARPENAVNFSYSALGSLFYLLGSICFIPQLDAILLGTEIFIVGSVIIFTSQSWKLYRYESFSTDWPATQVDFWAGIGGLAYCIGSIQFLPAYDHTDADTNNAALWFTTGGTAFTLSGIAIFYRYNLTVALNLALILALLALTVLHILPALLDILWPRPLCTRQTRSSRRRIATI